MGFYLRKSLRVGPLRFNFSKSGVGVSTGIKGFRVGTGPHGNYVHMGRGGLYYRRSLSGHSAHPGVSRTHLAPLSTPPRVAPSDGLTELGSGSALLMVDSSSADLLQELNAKRKLMMFWPAAAIVSVLTVAGFWISNAPGWGIVLAAMAGVAITAFARYKDEMRKSVVLYYNLEQDAEAAFQHIHDAFSQLRNADGAWHIDASGKVEDKKHHAGADAVVRRKETSPSKGVPPFVKTNIEAPVLPAGRQTLYFFPDCVLVYDRAGVGAVSYAGLELAVGPTKFIERNTMPRDAQVVGRTWKYVNKKGGPDKRFRDNRELPIALYEEVHFTSTTGLDELFNFSRSGVGTMLKQAVTELATVNKVAT